MENKKKDIAELLKEADELRRQEADIKAKMKAKKQVIASEYVDGLSDIDKQKQIAEAEKILENAKQRKLQAVNAFRAEVKAIKEDVAFAKQILAFVGYQQTASLPKPSNSFELVEGVLTFKRSGLKDISIDVKKPEKEWKADFKKALASQGLTDIDRTADNIVYKAKCLVESNIAVEVKQ